MKYNGDCKFDDYLNGRYVHELLNGPLKGGEKKGVKGGTIDLDNGTDMKDDDSCDGTERTGTRKYISIRVARGRCANRSSWDEVSFLDLSGDALKLYIRAYGKECYQSYITRLNESRKNQTNRGVVFRQLPVHDAESIIWIIIDHLLRAIPVGGEPQVNDFAIGALKAFLVHSIENAGDSRSNFSNFTLEEWTKCLHPGLSHTSPFLYKFCQLLDVDWTLWCIKGELPNDFLHEAVKRILLEEIVRIRSENRNVRLGPKDREPVITTTIGADAGMGESKAKRKSTTMLAPSSKRSRIVTELD